MTAAGAPESLLLEEAASSRTSRLTFDARTLMACKALRLFSFGCLSVIIVAYLQERGISLTRIGLLFTLTLLGDAVLSLYLTSKADNFGRRRTLVCGSLLSFITSAIYIFSGNFYVLLLTGIVGIISPSGNEVGPSYAIELSA